MPKKRRILCVDDHDDMCSLIATILSDYEVVSAQSKAEGLRKATGGLFDLYLLDYYLPDGTGLELCLLIRDFDDSTPILFVTDVSELGQQQIQNVNAQGLIRKDELPDALISAVANLLTR
jgi:CheY-like chemotaxis protein